MMYWQTSRFQLDLNTPKIMGIVNVTPDSFSGEGNYADAQQAVQHAAQLLQAGADILDLGAESTRPGAIALSAEAEWARLAPVLEEVVRWQVPISVDTYHAQTMQRALAHGADIINDVWALRQDGALAVVAQHAQCGVCVMHMHGEPRTMQLTPMAAGNAAECVDQVATFLLQRLEALAAAGIASARWCVDPGIGFGKTVEQNFALLGLQSALHEHLRPWQVPLLLGWSRKSSLGAVAGLPAAERLVPSVVAAVLAVRAGAHIVRVHDVAATRAGLAVLAASQAQSNKEG